VGKKVFGEKEKVGVKEKLRAERYNIFRRFKFRMRENKIRGTWVIKLTSFERRYLFIRVKGMLRKTAFIAVVGFSEGSRFKKDLILDKTARSYIGALMHPVESFR
jgi:hypothetical protein